MGSCTAHAVHVPDNIPRCPVCFDYIGYAPNKQFQRLTCGHVMCKQCITQLVKYALHRCPHCRAQIQKENVQNVYF